MTLFFRWSGHLLALLALLATAACGGEQEARVPVATVEADGMAKIEGSVFYRERMLLPPGVEVEVQLQDISTADAMATVLATVTLTPEGAPPYPFVIEYDPAGIDSRMRYALRASICVGDQLMFTSTDYIDPFKGNPVEVLVRRVPEPVQRDTPMLEGQVWTLATLAGEPAALGAGKKPLDIQFDAATMRVAGFSGCNRYMGAYEREGVSEHGSPLAFGPLAGTMMACAEGDELERQYLQLLGSVTGFRLAENTLSLLAGPEVLATFTAN